MIGLVPSLVIAVSVGRSGISSLLVASQVVLSVVLPFVAFPLILLTSSKSVMRVRKPRSVSSEKPSLRQPSDSVNSQAVMVIAVEDIDAETDMNVRVPLCHV